MCTHDYHIPHINMQMPISDYIFWWWKKQRCIHALDFITGTCAGTRAEMCVNFEKKDKKNTSLATERVRTRAWLHAFSASVDMQARALDTHKLNHLGQHCTACESIIMNKHRRAGQVYTKIAWNQFSSCHKMQFNRHRPQRTTRACSML